MHATSLTQIYAISFAMSCFSSFFAPAQAVTIPLLVPLAGLLAANARMQQSMQVVRMVSPALASALVAAFGERICYGADSASFFLSAAMLATLGYTRTVRLGPARLTPARQVFHELRVGAGFLFTDSDFTFAALALTAGIFAAGCFSTLAPVYVRDLLQRGPSVLGMIGSLIAAGTMAGAAGSAVVTRGERDAARGGSRGVARTDQRSVGVANIPGAIGGDAACRRGGGAVGDSWSVLAERRAIVRDGDWSVFRKAQGAGWLF